MKVTKANGKTLLKMKKAEWEEIGKKFKEVEAKKKGKVNPWAVCHTTVDKKKDPDKYERCVMEVKEKHKIKKD